MVNCIRTIAISLPQMAARFAETAANQNEINHQLGLWHVPNRLPFFENGPLFLRSFQTLVLECLQEIAN